MKDDNLRAELIKSLYATTVESNTDPDGDDSGYFDVKTNTLYCDDKKKSYSRTQIEDAQRFFATTPAPNNNPLTNGYYDIARLAIRMLLKKK